MIENTAYQCDVNRNASDICAALTEEDRQLDWKLLRTEMCTISVLAHNRGLDPNVYYGWLANIGVKKQSREPEEKCVPIITPDVKEKRKYVKKSIFSGIREKVKVSKLLSKHTIIIVILKHYGTSMSAVKSPSSMKELVRVRWAIAYFLYAHGLNLSEVGRTINRDSTTVNNALRKYVPDAELMRKLCVSY